jgi:hypothetical protein
MDDEAWINAGCPSVPPNAVRILVTGSREWTDREALEAELGQAYFRHSRKGVEQVIFVHGDCETGADRMCREWVAKAKLQGFNVDHEPHPANWYPNGRFDRGAGPKRNGGMVARGPYEGCLAFWDGKRERSGTLDCFALAVAAGIPVRIFPEKRR